ncbi:MAG: hypothetical protein JWP44_808, partial [Mucilaginibacter sp.]|nr:hypothetical protein [Mucilaginibacter sp.]
MKKLPLLLLLCIVLSTNAQKIIKTEQVSDHSIHIIGDRFEGVIFSKEYSPIFHLFPNNIKRCSIDTEDILSAERILAEDLRNKQSHKINDLFIRENLKKYLRQYAGYYDSKGRKIVIINFFWQKEILSEEKEHKALPHFF